MKTAYVLLTGLCQHYFRVWPLHQGVIEGVASFVLQSLGKVVKAYHTCIWLAVTLRHDTIVSHCLPWKVSTCKKWEKKLPPLRIRCKSLLPCGSISRCCPVISVDSFSNRCHERLQEWFMETHQTISVIGHIHCRLYASTTILPLY